MFNDCEQYEGFNGEHYTQKIVNSLICWLNAAEVVELDQNQIQYLYFGLFKKKKKLHILIVAYRFPRFCFKAHVHTGHRNLNEVLKQTSCDF